MKNKLLFIVLAMLFILSASLVGCENEEQTEDKTSGVVDKTPVASDPTIKLNYKNISMYDVFSLYSCTFINISIK